MPRQARHFLLARFLSSDLFRFSAVAWDLALPEVSLCDQSATFACLYYHARILIHRSPLSRVPIVPLDAPARKICTEAARACIHIADAHRRCRPDHPLLFSQNPVFTAGMVIVVDLAGNTDNLCDTAPDLALIRTAIDVLRSQQQRWPSSEFYDRARRFGFNCSDIGRGPTLSANLMYQVVPGG
ncbi:hypothetical protein K438DRAFT_1778034 [Mycena galopus ATCC 62051]|nr:hypothetical protein K438DRAFT_1778034 [Mycena galopus ATCC 62051]